MNILIVGAGFSGAVIAEQLSRHLDCKILIIDERDHLAGNCFSYRDDETNVMVHKYGPHIFNTDNEAVWNYVSAFGEFVPYVNRVKAIYDGRVYSLPINLHTINQFFDKCLSPNEARNFIASLGDTSIDEPKNFEEQALKFIGKALYEAFFYGYTKKQWGCEPSNLPASILNRLPVRFNYDDNYYSNIYQGIPREGYTAIIEKMLTHPSVEVKLSTTFDANFDIVNFDHVFYSGPIDKFFDYKFGRLGYRTVTFDAYRTDGDYQGNAVINYANESVPYTRVHEHKHFTPWEHHDKTIYFKEYSKETSEDDIPYYPKRLEADLNILASYQQEVGKLKNFTFIGRLATYRYLDMHHVIKESIDIAQNFAKTRKK